MAVRMKKTLTILISIVISMIGIFLAESWVFTLDFDTRGRILRAQIVVIIQSIIFGISVFVWKNLSDLFYVTSRKENGADIKGAKVTVNGYASDIHTSQTRPLSVKLWNSLVIIYLILVHASYISNVWFVRVEPSWFAIITYLLFAFHIQLIFILVSLKLVSYFKRLLTKRPIKHTRVAIIGLLYATSVACYGHYNAYYRPIEVKHVQIPVKDLPDRLNGMTITHLSDIHIGVTVGKSKLQEAVNIANNLNSDMTVIVGDLVDGYVYQIGEVADLLSDLKSKHGVYYVTGNHEYYTMDAKNWLLKLESVGVHVLHNSNSKIPIGQPKAAQICVAGVDDLEAERIGYQGHGMDLDKAMTTCDKDQPVILLAHQPKAAKIALDSRHRVDLVLSGHTHGGQMFPLTIGAYFSNPFYVGLYKYGEHSHVYVSQGTIYWGMPVRFWTRKEIIQITLSTLKQ